MLYNIYHYAGFGRNWGDLSLIYAMQKNLSVEAANNNQTLNFIPISIKESGPITIELVNLINLTGSMLLIGGGGLFMRGDGCDTESGWQVNITLENLEKIKVPIAVYAIGYNRFPYDEPMEPEAWEHLKGLQKLSAYFSVRDSGTREIFMEKGLTDMEVVPDPAMNITPIPNCPQPLDNDTFYIGVNWAGDRANLRSPKKQEVLIEQLCASLYEVCSTNPNSKVLFIPHVHYDYTSYPFFQKHLDMRKIDNLKTLCPYLYPESAAYVPIFASVYKRMDVVIGMRGHALIIPYGQGTPTIALGDHHKATSFVIETGSEYMDHNCKGLFDKIEKSLIKSKRDLHRNRLMHFMSFSRVSYAKVLRCLRSVSLYN